MSDDRFNRIMIVLAVIGWLAIAAALAAAFARDNGSYADNPLRSWVENLKNERGIGCCASADGYAPQMVEWDTAGNNYRVFVNGKWLVVEEWAVIKSPNLLGYARVWLDTEGRVRCFLPDGGV